jgi:hypothetical protein
MKTTVWPASTLAAISRSTMPVFLQFDQLSVQFGISIASNVLINKVTNNLIGCASIHRRIFDKC